MKAARPARHCTIGSAFVLFVERLDTLVEAKGNAERDSIRMAIGQLLDYRRFYKPTPTCAVLLPEKPSDDLRKLIERVGMQVFYRAGKSFVLQKGGGVRVRLPKGK